MPRHTDRERKIADLRTQGTGGLNPLIPQVPTVGSVAPQGPQATVNVDPLGLGAEGFQNRMNEIKEFTATNPELQFQRDSAVTNRIADPEARAGALAGLRQDRIGAASKERLAAISGSGKAKFSAVSTPVGAAVTNLSSGESTITGGIDPILAKNIEATRGRLGNLTADRRDLMLAGRPTEILDTAIAAAEKNLNALFATESQAPTEQAVSGHEQANAAARASGESFYTIDGKRYRTQ